MHAFWRGTRQEFESEPTWRATIRRGGTTYFILEGKGSYVGKFYEYEEGQHPSLGLERNPVDIEKLKHEEEIEVLIVLKGKLPEKKS
jgi:hypothetical protein